MTNIQLQLTAISPIIHSEEVNSNISTLFRLNLIGYDGDIYSIPVIKGNSIRGLLRNLIFNFLFNEVGIFESANLQRFHEFFSGGFLDGSDSSIDLQDRRFMRQLFPELSIFGAAMGNKMLRGKMNIGFIIPNCLELGNGDVSIYDSLSIIRHTRQDDSKSIEGEKYLPAQEALKNSQQMFYDIETINIGTTFTCECVIDGTELELSAFAKCIELLQKTPFIGGKSAAGYGKILIKHNFISTKDLYEKHVQKNKSAIKAFIESK